MPPIKNYFLKCAGSFFYLGYLPLIPGTFGSLAGVGIFYLLKAQPLSCLAAAVFLLILGLLICGKLEKIYQKKDPRCIVIDEVCGMLIALSFMPLDLRIIFLGFIFFRILDTLKPYPASALQERPGAFGVMGDDLVAGIYTNLLLQLLLRFTSFKTV